MLPNRKRFYQEKYSEKNMEKENVKMEKTNNKMEIGNENCIRLQLES